MHICVNQRICGENVVAMVSTAWKTNRFGVVIKELNDSINCYWCFWQYNLFWFSLNWRYPEIQSINTQHQWEQREQWTMNPQSQSAGWNNRLAKPKMIQIERNMRRLLMLFVSLETVEIINSLLYIDLFAFVSAEFIHFPVFVVYDACLPDRCMCVYVYTTVHTIIMSAISAVYTSKRWRQKLQPS